jgi:hypothetical protein
MEKRTREQIVAVLRPVYVLVSFVAGIADKVLFGWLALWNQKRENASLTDDIKANLYFLFSAGEVVKERWTKVHPFDYASVQINSRNIGFVFTRGQSQLNVLLSPRHAPRDTHELSIVLAALDSTDVREQKPPSYLSEVGDLLRPRLDALNEAFSEPRYAEFREKLAAERATVRLLARQAEWALNKGTSH